MTLLLIRHAIAVPRGTPDIPDEERPLTPRGARRFRKAARGLARVVRRPDLLLTSPLARARATAEIAADAWGRLTPTREPALAERNPGPLVRTLSSLPADSTVAAVGHEPQLSAVLARLLRAGAPDRLAFRKGGVALVELENGPAGGGRLVWFLSPKLLRRLGRS
jgi:phosphohistidine phosphatase